MKPVPFIPRNKRYRPHTKLQMARTNYSCKYETGRPFRNMPNANPRSPVPSKCREEGWGVGRDGSPMTDRDRGPVVAKSAEKSTPAPLLPVCASMISRVLVPAFNGAPLSEIVSIALQFGRHQSNGRRRQ